MANWSNEMWRNVVNRAVRLLPLSPFGMHFITAFATNRALPLDNQITFDKKLKADSIKRRHVK
ncbi:hypothetical protein KIN20_034097 [Parelaphostrongylus tenuis]|uniref:Uncharacterized protein n=1 Tax=Parelaphostrongylus tenuis TaxID=148309 RepID=A0AAD5R9K1_PARTN|nr:hypothetical protein KIN20_034097 [Parelaphostrongylus tenuis]